MQNKIIRYCDFLLNYFDYFPALSVISPYGRDVWCWGGSLVKLCSVH